MPTQIETFAPDNLLQPVKWPQDARQDSAGFAPNLTLAKGTVLGKITTGGKLKAYASGNADGSQTAVAILAVSIKTDANGKVYFSTDTNSASYTAVPQNEAPIWVAGTFDTAELTGYDATAKTGLGGRITHDGYLRIP